MHVAVAAAEERAGSQDAGRRAPLIGEDFNCDCYYLPHFIFTVATLILATDYEYFVYYICATLADVRLCFVFGKISIRCSFGHCLV